MCKRGLLYVNYTEINCNWRYHQRKKLRICIMLVLIFITKYRFIWIFSKNYSSFRWPNRSADGADRCANKKRKLFNILEPVLAFSFRFTHTQKKHILNTRKEKEHNYRCFYLESFSFRFSKVIIIQLKVLLKNHLLISPLERKKKNKSSISNWNSTCESESGFFPFSERKQSCPPSKL